MMRTEEAEALESRIMGRVSLLLRKYVVPAFLVALIGPGIAIVMVAHASRVSEYNRCKDGVVGAQVTLDTFGAVIKALRDRGAVEGADLVQEAVNQATPRQTVQNTCGDPPEWWDT